MAKLTRHSFVLKGLVKCVILHLWCLLTSSIAWPLDSHSTLKKKIFTEPLLGLGCLENTANEPQLPVLSFNHLIIYSLIQAFTLNCYQHHTAWKTLEASELEPRLHLPERRWAFDLPRFQWQGAERGGERAAPMSAGRSCPHRGPEHGSKLQEARNAAGLILSEAGHRTPLRTLPIGGRDGARLSLSNGEAGECASSRSAWST